MCKIIETVVKNSKAIYIIGGVVVAVAGWFFMMNGIPERVSGLEKDVAELKVSLASQDTKLNLIVQSVYEIRAVLLKGK